MRIIHLATSLDGGAGIAAKNIVSSQIQIGLDAKILTRDHMTKSLKSLPKKYMGKFVTLFTRFVTVKKYGFISPISISTLDRAFLIRENPDIINVHNWYNFLSISDLEWLIKSFRVVFTLHDARLATGGCHTTLSCLEFKNLCKQCPASRLDYLVTYHKASMDTALTGEYTLVSPSKWLLDLLAESHIVKSSRNTRVISNPVEIEFTGPIKGTRNRRHTKALFIAANLEPHFKGLDLLITALEILDQDLEGSNLEVEFIGGISNPIKTEFKNISVKYRGVISRQDVQKEMFDADLLFVPSRSDNFPSVITEAQLSGVLVVATNVGGIPEMVSDENTGFLAEPNPSSLAVAIRRALWSKKNWVEIKRSAKVAAAERADNLRQAENYRALYEELTNG